MNRLWTGREEEICILEQFVDMGGTLVAEACPGFCFLLTTRRFEKILQFWVNKLIILTLTTSREGDVYDTTTFK
jgi:hypothetical protein